MPMDLNAGVVQQAPDIPVVYVQKMDFGVSHATSPTAYRQAHATRYAWEVRLQIGSDYFASYPSCATEEEANAKADRLKNFLFMGAGEEG